MSDRGAPPLIAHVIHRLATGGMENGLVNLINHIPPERYRHAIVCLTGADEFRERIRRADVDVIELHKPDRQDWSLYRRLWRLFRERRPDLVHTRNLAALEAQLPARLAGVGARVHSEHGWEVNDAGGANPKYRRLRRLFRPLISHYVALSTALERDLREQIGVAPSRLSRICNGVDSERFRPRGDAGRHPALNDLAPAGTLLVGSTLRMSPIKDPLNLVDAFIELAARDRRWRLALLGGGELLESAARRLAESGLDDRVWLPGNRADVAELMPSFDLFALPSRSEGISNTVLEAMACGLPVVATRVGGTPELVVDGVTGALVPPANAGALAAALEDYADPTDGAARIARHGDAARRRVEEEFSIGAMVERYLDVYDRVLRRQRVT